MSLISTLRGFPSDEKTDVYGIDTKLDFATFEIQWSNQEDDPAAAGGEVGGEGVFVGAVVSKVRTRRREGARGMWFTWCICVLWLGGRTA